MVSAVLPPERLARDDLGIVERDDHAAEPVASHEDVVRIDHEDEIPAGGTYPDCFPRLARPQGVVQDAVDRELLCDGKRAVARSGIDQDELELVSGVILVPDARKTFGEVLL